MIVRWQDHHVVFAVQGRRKLLDFRFSDPGMLLIFNELFVDRDYFKDFGKGRNFSIGPRDTVIDIGANTGFFSVYAANVAYKGRVFAFEPVSANFDQLMAYKMKYRMDNLMVEKMALSDARKEVKIFLSEKNIGGHSFFKEKISALEKEDVGRYETVPCIPLKEVFDANGITSCDYLKIDVEGAEYEIFEALPAEYFRRIKKIAMEYHPVDGKSAWVLADRLNELGFAIYMAYWTKNFGRLYAYRKKP